MRTTTSHRGLLIVDPQNDFISGSLAVPGATTAMDALTEHIRQHGTDYFHIFVTSDWHPANHCSFKSEGGIWPQHCVQQTVGAQIYTPLLTALLPFSPTMLYKGQCMDTEEYSIFKNSTATTQLCSTIIEENITQMDLCGIAGDVCVLETYHDGIALFSPEFFRILPSFCPSLDGGKSLEEVLS